MIALFPRLRRWSGVALGAASAAVAVPVAYLAMVTIAGTPRPRAGRPGSATHRFVILVPAHDEAAGIGETLDSLQELDYPADRVAVHVVADNCTDDTSAVVRSHGFESHDRIDPTDPGKGPALNWLFDRLVERDEAFDAAVIVDADTTVDDAFLRHVDAVLAQGAVAAQGRYSVRDATASPATSFRYAALACRHHLRPLGRTRLGASCGLYGNGMVFRRDVLAEHRWSGHLVEDAQFQMELLLDGHDVAYVPEAVVRAEMPTSLDDSETQNERWEQGRISLVTRYVPQLLRRIPSSPGRRRAIIDAIADHLVPPLSVLVGLNVALAGLATAARVARVPGARSAARLNVAGLVVVAAHVLVGLYSVRASRRHVFALLRSPHIVWWKIRLWSSVLTRDEEVAWTRTQRNLAPEKQAS